ncbi:MAG: L-threonine 3-dehydrogenase [Nitrospirae bacterium 13_2_20CM_2_61_4]|nr:MAG: L-threonine 3-dehydrogenase [Nitrospirae bacterium 13_2_20CM_2_61_4]
MRALVKSKPSPGLELQNVPVPQAGPGEVIVRIAATSLCGTDNHIYRWDEWAQGRVHPPRIIGHEMCGHVVDLGPGVTSVKMGDYVAAESHLTCGICFQCRTGNAHVCKNYRILGIDLDGSYAEHVRLPERVLWKTSPEIPPELACLQEPLGNAVHAALVEEITGQSVLITGCGPTGLFAAAVARTAGAGLIIATDGSDYRLALAKRVGVDAAVKAGAGEAEISLFGIAEGPLSFDMNEIIFKGIRVFGITGRKLFKTWYRLAGLFRAGLNITPVVTHTLPMERFAEGFDLIAKGQCGKIVLLP